jgi:hypothetical protein
LLDGFLGINFDGETNDISPGFGPKVSNYDTGNGYGTRVFWTAKVADSAFTYDLTAGTAHLKVDGLTEYDYPNFPASDSTDWQFPNSAAHPNGFFLDTVSFETTWYGPATETDVVKDTANGFAGTFNQDDATTTWQVTSSDKPVGGGQHFTFTADPSNAAVTNGLIPGGAFSQLGTEQNGIFFPSGASLQPDALNPSLTDLVVDGSSTGGVHIQVRSANNGKTVRVKIDGDHQNYQADFPTASISRLIVNGGPGNNLIEVAHDVQLPALLLGSFGDDHIQGGGGRTIIIGGLGSDHLEAGSGAAILIGGITDFDHSGDGTLAAPNLAALDALLTEWSTDESYSQRVANLSNSTVNGVAPNGLGLNDGNFLNASTVHDDGARNQLDSGPGQELDWFFAGVLDHVSGRKRGEILTGVT